MAAALPLNFPLYTIIIAEAVLAAVISWLRGMDWWWWCIQFLFPIAVVVFLAFNISPSYFLVAFFFLMVLFWSTYRTQVPYYPSRSSLLPHIRDLLPAEQPVRFIDIGSGLGGLVLSLARIRGDSQFSGVEIAPLPWVLSYLRARLTRSRASFFLQNYLEMNLQAYDFVFAYLSPAAMPALWQKAKSEMRAGSMLLSYEFVIPGAEPDLCINTGDNAPILYAWRI
ncbi:class I SAM-dependent methyltransferase [Undibacterium terreum]|uniref:class I SAM-dependent methyltransferase n=1 Tax=Undibacterium terreum TaxID=1224302 RepID=UPI001E457D2C|nr:class I SAM-dependent methyltransferase [Undibacterium terreum]